MLINIVLRWHQYCSYEDEIVAWRLKHVTRRAQQLVYFSLNPKITEASLC
jgi:hypothetical protein